MEPTKGKIIYELKEGDEWRVFENHIIVVNPAHPPFMIDLFTGERKELTPDAKSIRPSIE